MLTLLLLCAALEFEGRVVEIVDGDTVGVMHDGRAERIRLHGIDAPEKRQAYGRRAQDFLGEMIFKQTVRVVVRSQDRYGRTVADLYLGRKHVNHEMVRAGMAWWFRRYAPRDQVLRELEEEAREAGRGLWADPDATAPWNFRKPR
ncbi:MAG: thermonuclease family protein [Bryobacteraceae bacterium]|nr:thermonuclease family protein [Bryobacteraceae bacterium]